MALTLLSSAFEQGKPIPQKYSCDGDDISLPLYWENVPAGTKSLVMIFDDPDAPMGTWDHWILFNMPATVTELTEDIGHLPDGTVEGMNSWGRTGYGGPCPPDKEHRYFFKLYALDKKLDLIEGVKKEAVEAAMHDHILEQAQLMGTYDRS